MPVLELLVYIGAWCIIQLLNEGILLYLVLEILLYLGI